jgi:SOS-response transcriptional repressor LexA
MPRMSEETENQTFTSEIEQRIEARLKLIGKSARAVSMEAGGSPDLIRNITRGKSRSPRGENLTRLANILGVTVEWLMTGKGDFAVAPPEAGSHQSRLAVPLLSWVSAGKMSFPDITDEIIGTVEESGLDPEGDWVALQVVGDSMDRISPPESIIFVDRRDKVLVPNACYVISNGDGEATYKRFRSNPMRFEPVSTNPAHEPIYPSREPLIVGRVKKSTIQM